MNCFEDFLKGNDRYDCSHYIVAGLTAHDRCGNCHCHFLSRANDLRPAYYNAPTVHLSQHLAHPLVNFHPLNQVRLKSSMHFAVNRPDSQPNQIGILFQSLLQTRIITGAAIVKAISCPERMICGWPIITPRLFMRASTSPIRWSTSSRLIRSG